MLRCLPESLKRGNSEQLVKEALIEDLKNRYGSREFIFCEPQILKTHLRKTIIKYTIDFDTSHKTYIGIHRESDDERFRYVFRILDLLRSNGFDETSELRVPRPIIFLPSLYLIIMDEAEGNLLSTAISEQTLDAESSIEGSAKWLVKLHNVAERFPSNDRSMLETNSYSQAGGSHRHAEKERDILTSIKYSEPLMTIFPSMAEKIQVIAKELVSMQRKKRLRNNITPNGIGRFSFIHGDYHTKNIYVLLNSITVIDFEESRLGDPAFDLGYFAAQLKMSFGSSPRISRWIDLFFRKYLEESRLLMQEPCSDDEASLERRMKIYEAQTYFQRSYHTYWLLRLQPDVELFSKWLEESRLVLGGAKEVGNYSS